MHACSRDTYVQSISHSTITLLLILQLILLHILLAILLYILLAILLHILHFLIARKVFLIESIRFKPHCSNQHPIPSKIRNASP